MGHFLFIQIRLLAVLGILPRKLLKVKPPKCSGGLYGAMTNHPWRTKSASKRFSIQKASAPVEFISVYQIEYSTPGFIVQLKGKPTKHRYCAATIFLDNYSNFT